ncbi:unnamed protein product [Aphanomyces euteiches]
MAKLQGLAARIKARKSTPLLAKYGVPIALLLLAIGVCLLPESIDLWPTTEVEPSLKTPGGWMRDVVDEKRRGDLLFDAEQFEPALEFYIRAMNLAVKHHKENSATPDESKLMRSYLSNCLAMTYVQLGKDAEATTWYKRGLEINGDHLELLYNYANLCSRTEKWVAAEGYYRKVLKLKPSFQPAMASLAFVLQQQGALEDSRTLLLDSWDLSKDDPEVAAQLGWQYMAESDSLKALEWFDVAVKMGHEDAKKQRDDIMAAWMKTQEMMAASSQSIGNHESDTMPLADPVL